MSKVHKAFTLIELMVAMGVVAVLATMSLFGIQTVQRSLRNTQRRDVVEQLALQLEGYNSSFGAYPQSSALVYSSADGQLQLVDGGTVVDRIPVSGSAIPVASLDGGNESDGTLYCYTPNANGSAYTLGVKIEGGDWEQFGNDLQADDCSTANVFI